MEGRRDLLQRGERVGGWRRARRAHLRTAAAARQRSQRVCGRPRRRHKARRRFITSRIERRFIHSESWEKNGKEVVRILTNILG